MYKAIIIYETRSGATGAIARTIEDVLKEAGIEVTSKRILNAEE
jgi:flavodoxin